MIRFVCEPGCGASNPADDWIFGLEYVHDIWHQPPFYEFGSRGFGVMRSSRARWQRCDLATWR